MTTQAPAAVAADATGSGADLSARDHSNVPAERNRPDARVRGVRSFDPADFPVPTGREEEWRFTPLSRLAGLTDPSTHPVALGPEHVVGSLPSGVTATTVGRDHPKAGVVLLPFDRVSAVAWAGAREVFLIQVARDTVVAEPVLIGIHGRGADGVAHGHTVIDVADGAEVVIVLDHSGTAVLSDNVEVTVGANARLTLVTVQGFDPGSVHAQHQKVRLERDARILHIAVTLGGDLVRQYTSVEYAGRGGDAEALGIYFAGAGQHLEHRLLVDHSVPDCRSNVAYRGALQGADAHTVWVGDVVIRPDATGTDTYEINRNLVLSDGARADSIPNLEIETGEVAGAGHASATGRFDDEQLFYLQSRGISAEEARRLVVRGFFAELLQRIPVPELRDRLAVSLEARLAEAGA
jgi:Fe-S cluster assembly protein SufD